MLLRRMEAHFAGPGWPALERVTVRHGEVGVVVDYALLRGHCADSDLAIAMEMHPADALACIAGAVHEVHSGPDHTAWALIFQHQTLGCGLPVWCSLPESLI